ncbi:unnamed protein product, partial [Ectocarpus sp. 12 AP-2014]
LEVNGQQDNNDDCADASSGSSSFPQLTFQAPCSTVANGLMSIPYCFAWDNQKGNTCTDGDDVKPSQSSQCVCDEEGFTVPEECLV